MEHLGKLFFYAALFAFCVVALIFWNLSRHDQQSCDYIESLAENPRVVNALDTWALENVIDEGYYFVSGMHGSIAAHKNEDDDIYYLPLPDSEVTGIESEYFRFSLSKHKSKHHDNITKINVHSLYFGRGRDHVILTKNGHSLGQGKSTYVHFLPSSLIPPSRICSI